MSDIFKLDTTQIAAQNAERIQPGGFGESIIWLHNIRSMHNVGSAFRSADAFGVKMLILSGYTPSPPRAEISKTALGADEYVNWQYFSGHEEAYNYLKNLGYHFIGLEQTSDSVPIYDLPFGSDGRLCLVFGNEVTGIDDEILDCIDNFAEIPQYGKKHSLNVSVAVGIALYAVHELFRKGLPK